MGDMSEIFGVNGKYNNQRFQNLNLYNRDVKAILDEEGKIVFGYSFIDLNTLMFFTNDVAFIKIVKSLQNNKKR
jgi:hypothetical protein